MDGLDGTKQCIFFGVLRYVESKSTLNVVATESIYSRVCNNGALQNTMSSILRTLADGTKGDERISHAMPMVSQ